MRPNALRLRRLQHSLWQLPLIAARAARGVELASLASLCDARFKTDLDSELMLFNEEANEVIVYVLA